MKNIHQIKHKLKNPVVTVGTFDGVHLGHQKIMRLLIERAKKINGTSVVITYHPHPLEILRERHYPYLLTEQSKKEDFLKKIGIDYVLWLDFDKKLAGMSPLDFVEEYFVEKITAKEIIVGYDWHFGKNQEGDFHLLKKYENKFNFKVDMVDKVLVEGETVSSTIIRKYLQQGRIQKVNQMLGRKYSIIANIISKKGKKDIYAIKLKAEEFRKLFPNRGLYFSKLVIGQREVYALSIFEQNFADTSQTKIIKCYFSSPDEIEHSDVELFMIKKLPRDSQNETIRQIETYMSAKGEDGKVTL
ncbi:MAG: bifunctional riboflavin kinase/FAD synthetase [Candidatus Cloacimonadota bacterium]|nr:bifunctional riboflavin kinase/FAD synthetase [Candidatus Cloacimonadota bacterium]